MSNTPKRKGSTPTTTQKRRTQLPTVETARRPNPWPKRLAYLGGLGLVLVILGGVFLGGGDEDLPDGPPADVQELAVGTGEHVEGEIPYDDAVPAGGPHNPVWLNCGFYDSEVPAENAVHALEHGAVWITYRDDVAQADVDALRSLTRNRPQLIVSLVPGLDTELRATAWGVNLKLDAYDDVTLRQFIRYYTDRTAPEPAANCQGGVGNPA